MTPKKDRDRRAYGKSPLVLNLAEALALVGKISQEGRTVPESKLAIILGNTISSSAFTKKIRALGSYGLLSEQADGQFTLTDLAISIALPRSLQEEAEAKKLAFLNIEAHKLIFQQHKGKLLPADEFLRNILEQDLDIPREYSHDWAKSFKEGARIAGLFYDRGDGKVQISDSPLSESAPTELRVDSREVQQEIARREVEIPGFVATPKEIEPQQQQSPYGHASGQSGHITRIDLSGGRRAEISIPDQLSARDAQKLQRALDGVKVIIESMISEE